MSFVSCISDAAISGAFLILDGLPLPGEPIPEEERMWTQSTFLGGASALPLECKCTGSLEGGQGGSGACLGIEKGWQQARGFFPEGRQDTPISGGGGGGGTGRLGATVSHAFAALPGNTPLISNRLIRSRTPTSSVSSHGWSTVHPLCHPRNRHQTTTTPQHLAEPSAHYGYSHWPVLS